MSTGESCTCVPTIYSGEVTGQQEAFGALIEYLQPEHIKARLQKFIRDYNLFKFEQEEDWDDAERISAETAHEEAMKMLRTLFNDLPSFKNKAAAESRLEECHTKTDSLVDELTQDCEKKLKDTAEAGYTRLFEAQSLDRLKREIDPLIAAGSQKVKKPALWPLVRQVR